MTSQKRRDANAKNARHSTGPKTARGKNVSKMNALKHGLCATSILLPTESAKEFEGFARSLEEYLSPKNELERVLARLVVANAWKALRASRLEAMWAEVQFLDERSITSHCDAERQIERRDGLADMVIPSRTTIIAVSYTHLRAHET